MLNFKSSLSRFHLDVSKSYINRSLAKARKLKNQIEITLYR